MKEYAHPLQPNIAHLFRISTIVCIALSVFSIASAANETVPLTHTYNGYLLDTDGNPLQDPHTFRFSYWSSGDALAGDIGTDGQIDTAAANFGLWQEVQTVQPDSNGYFSVELGSVNPFPRPDLVPEIFQTTLYLQVEARLSTDPVTAYEILDVDPSDDTLDRSAVRSVPSALNANFIDWHEIGTAEGDIPILLEGGYLSVSHIPSGVTHDTFILDTDGDATDRISLQFGPDDADTFSFDPDADTFYFSRDVVFDGDVTIQGDLLGVTRSDTLIFLPHFSNVSYEGDGTTNVGRLLVEHDEEHSVNAYAWRSSQSTLNDYDIILSVTIPEDFITWNDGTLQITYRTESIDPADNGLDVFVYDTGKQAVALSSAMTSLVTDDTWTTLTVDFSGDPTWSAGQEFEIVFRPHSRENNAVFLQKVALQYQRSL